MNTYRRLIRIALVVYWLLLFTATHLPPVALPKTNVSDKLEHFTAYCLLSMLLSLALGSARITPKTCLLAFAIAAGFGAVDEWTQPIVGRICDLHDWYADANGAIAGTTMVLVVALIARRLFPRVQNPHAVG